MIGRDHLQPCIVQRFNNSLRDLLRFFNPYYSVSPIFESITNCGGNNGVHLMWIIHLGLHAPNESQRPRS